MKAIVCRDPGGPEVLRLAEHPDPATRAGELLVRVHAAGVNRADLLQRMGHYPPPPGASPILGLELAGEVVAAGGACTRRRAGEHVMALVTGGAYAELAAVPEETAMPVPARWTWEEAAAVPEAFLTAWLNLFDLGRLAGGESVLVHAGASGVGSAAIQLAREAGADVLATAGSDAVHLVLDFVGAPYWERNLQALRRGGRLVLVGFLGGSSGMVDLGPVLRKSLTVKGTTLRGTPLPEKGALVERFLEFAAPRFEDGRLRPVLDRSFPLEDAAAAHAYMAENRNIGKIVLTVLP